jgi:hypothetical protein
MIRRLGVAFGAALLLSATIPAAANPTALAPADAYFGRQGMSILGLRNAVKDIDLREDLHLADDGPVLYHKLLIVEDAMNDWRRKYPQDSWVPRLGFALGRVWMKLGYADARDHAGFTLGWVIADYPTNSIAPWATAFRNAASTLATADREFVEPSIPIENH